MGDFNKELREANAVQIFGEDIAKIKLVLSI